MQKIFIAWDMTTPSLRTTLESLRRRPPAGMTFDVPGLSAPVGGEILRDVVVPGIVNADRTLVLLDKPNANVAFETGLAYGLGRELALVVQASEIPQWLRDPPFANFLVTKVRGVEDLGNALGMTGVWHRPNGGEVTADPMLDRTLFLCPDDHEGQACVRERLASYPRWRTPPAIRFNLLDLPEVTAGVTQLVWTVTAHGVGTDERDGAANAQNAVIAGWFAAQTLLSLGGQLDAKAMSSMRDRLCVLRSVNARPVVDVGPFERTFGSPDEYERCLKRVPQAPLLSARQAGTRDVVLEVRQRLQTLLRAALTTAEVPDLAAAIGGDGLRESVATVADKTARIDALLDYGCQDGRVRDGFLERLRKRVPADQQFDELMALLEHRDVPASLRSPDGREADRGASGPSLHPNPSLADVLSTAIRLDRTTQWGQVLDQCQSGQHSLFLLRGESRQSLGLFLDRLRHFLADHTPRHRVFNVRFQADGVFAETGAEWEQRLAWVLGPGQPGTAAHHLAHQARQLQPFLILGLQPLHDLTERQQAGLREFLEVHYPACLAEAASARPVHLLLAVDYDDGNETFADAVDRWALATEERHNEAAKADHARHPGRYAPGSSPRLLHYVHLPPVHFPTWDEVDTYLMNCRPRPTEEVRTRIKHEFERLVQTPGTTFYDLANQLDRRIGPF